MTEILVLCVHQSCEVERDCLDVVLFSFFLEVWAGLGLCSP